MRYIFVLLAILCGIVLVLKIDAGTLDASQVAGIGLILLGVAVCSPSTWPNMPG